MGQLHRTQRLVAFEANRGHAELLVKYVARVAGYTAFLAASAAAFALRGRRRSFIRVKSSAHLCRIQLIRVCCALVVGIVCVDPSGATTVGPAAPAAVRASASELFPKRLLAFEANRGQAEPQVKYLARGAGYTAFLTSSEVVLALRGPGGPAVVRMKLVGADPSPEVVASARFPGTVNYAKGDDRAKWLTDVPTFGRVTYRAVYPGVDVVYYGSQRQLEYDFVVAPGADPEAIRLSFDGVNTLEVDAGGELVLQSPGGEIRKSRPVVYQEVDGIRRAVAGRYVVHDGRSVGFAVEAYDRTRPLVIDPVILYSTYLGGTGEDVVSDIAVDAQGNIYVTGTTDSADFPTAVGAHQPAAGGLEDAFVTKLTPAGAVVYSTYLGGQCRDRSHAIAVDSAGNAYITGEVRDNLGCPLPDLAAVMVAKFNSTGGAVYVFTFGASTGRSIAVDTGGHAYVTGLALEGDFRTTPGAFQETFGGDTADAFVAKVNASGTELVYATYLGGSGSESGQAIAVDAAGNAYVGGSTQSRDFPLQNPFQPMNHGATPLESNAFVAKLNPTGSALVYSTYLGGSDNTAVLGIAVDAAGSAYVTGVTFAEDFPTTPGSVQPRPGDRVCFSGPCSDAFVTKFDPSGMRAYSTYLYGELDDQGIDITVDGAGNAYVVGATTSLYFPILKAFQPNAGGLGDGFVTKLNPSGSALLYSSYLGGSRVHGHGAEGTDTAHGIAVDATGNAYIAGQTYSFNFPTTPDAQDRSFAGAFCDTTGLLCSDGFITIVAADGPGVIPAVRIGAAPSTVPGGGTVTASWAGIPMPTTSDRIHLNTLGGGRTFSFDELAALPTEGAASGLRTFTLPTTATPGFYELRLLSLDSSGVLVVIARSEPFRVHQPARTSATIAAIDRTATEAGTTPGVFRVSRTGSTAAPLTVFYTVGGTATAGSDYTALPGRVTIPAGVATANVVVTPINDSLMESNETVIATLRPNAAYTIGAARTATVTIVSDERVSLSAIDPTATEAGRTPGIFRVSRTGSTAAPLTVFYTVRGTATAGSDYAALPGRVTIPAGVATAAVVVTPINDNLMESDETVIATLRPNAAYTIGSPGSVTVTIVSDERISLSAIDPTATEAGRTPGIFRVSRTGSTAASLTVFYTVGGTATARSDYAALPGMVTIPAGAATVVIRPINDSLMEGNETVIASLRPNASYTIGSPRSATVTIVSDE